MKKFLLLLIFLFFIATSAKASSKFYKESSSLHSFNAVQNSFHVNTAGGGTLSYTISDDASWLSCDPVSGDSTGEEDTIVINYDVSGLAVGTYRATITIDAGEAGNSPQTIDIILVVYDSYPKGGSMSGGILQ